MDRIHFAGNVGVCFYVHSPLDYLSVWMFICFRKEGDNPGCSYDMPSPTLSHKLRYSEIRWLLEIENDISILYSEIEDKEAKFD